MSVTLSILFSLKSLKTGAIAAYCVRPSSRSSGKSKVILLLTHQSHALRALVLRLALRLISFVDKLAAHPSLRYAPADTLRAPLEQRTKIKNEKTKAFKAGLPWP